MPTVQELLDRSDKLDLLFELIKASTRTDKDTLLNRVRLAINTTNVELEAARQVEDAQDRQAEEDELKLREGEIDPLAAELGVDTTRSR